MVPIWISVVFIALVTLWLAVDIPRREAQETTIIAEVAVSDFIAYRQAVQRYVRDHPAATGTIADADLGPYWLKGYESYDPANAGGWVRTSSWTNMIDSGMLYVYTSDPSTLSANTVDMVYKKSGESLLIGTKNPNSGNLISPNGWDTGIHLPGGIPNNAMVIVGR